MTSSTPGAIPAATVAAIEVALGDRVERDRSLADLTTYRVGGRSEVFVSVEDHDDLVKIARLTSSDVATLVVGLGSNLLVADGGFAGIAIRLGDGFAAIEIHESAPQGGSGGATTVRAGGGASLPRVARRTAAEGLTGFEWAVGVPGSIGGAVRMNAGGHGSDIAASLQRVRVLDLQTGHDEVVEVSSLDLGYRRSALGPHQVVEWAELRLQWGDAVGAQAEIDEIVRWRREHQPGGPNAGSVFTNPPGDSAGRLIDAAGCKGTRVGSAEVSPKHANFIQADAGGSADDVVALMLDLQRRVEESTGVRLIAETRLIGFDSDLIAPLFEPDTESDPGLDSGTAS
jgi:UDP-N-acetylmuramate dehydrogenase